MPGTARYRSNHVEQIHTGSFTFDGGPPFYDSMTLGVAEECNDIVGNRLGANPFAHWHIDRDYPFLDGATGVWEFNQYPIGHHSPYFPDPIGAFAEPNWLEQANLAFKILAETNPSSPHVSLPSAIGELKDLPMLIKSWGQNVLKKLSLGNVVKDIAGGNLWVRFGLRPMLSDIKKLTQFVKVSNEKFTQLRRLRDGKTLRKRINLGYDQVISSKENVIMHSQGAFITGTRQNIYTSKSWGSAEWKLLPDSDIPHMSDEELMKFSRRLVLGVTSYGALETAWELLPWSWLVDWFSNVGEFIAAHNNSVPCTSGRVCYMRTTKGIAVFEVDHASIPAGITLGGQYKLEVTRKLRLPVAALSPVPLPYLPILDGGKLSILASLAALRR